LESKINFVGVGSMRCGATSVFERIIHGTNIEPPIDFRTRQDRFCHKEVRAFLRYVSDYEYEGFFPTEGTVRGEWTPMYILYEGVLKRIKNYNPDMKIIYSVRDPIDRIISTYNKHIGNCSIIEAINKSSKSPLKQGEHFTKALVYGSMYSDHIKRIYKLFPRENVFIIKFEDMIKDQDVVIDNLLNFLGAKKIVKHKQRYQKANMSYANDLKRSEVSCLLKDCLIEDTKEFVELTGIDYRSSYDYTN